MAQDPKIDPERLSYEFKAVWFQFRTSKAREFLTGYLLKEKSAVTTALENTGPQDLGKHQGAMQVIRKMLALLEKDTVEGPLKEVVSYLEKN